MVTDTLTVFRKEWKEMFYHRGVRGYLFNWIIMVLLVGVYMPIQVGAGWFNSPVMLLLWSWPALQLISALMADGFAGEKERHTLETLLASRLPDLSIFSGKMLAGLVYAGSIFPASLFLGAVTVNLKEGISNGVRFYNMGSLLQILALHYLSLILIAAVGMLVSMRSSSVKSAYQKIAIAILVLVLSPSLLMGVLSPDIKTQLMQFITAPRLGAGALAAALAMLVIDIVLFVVCLKGFKREQLLTA